MQTNFETLSSLERRLTMAVPVDSIEREVDDRLRKLSRTVRMPGFRPGKVPVKLWRSNTAPRCVPRSSASGAEGFRGRGARKEPACAGNRASNPRKTGLKQASSHSVRPSRSTGVKLGDLSSARIQRPTLTVGDAEVEHTLEILRKQRVQYAKSHAQRSRGPGHR